MAALCLLYILPWVGRSRKFHPEWSAAAQGVKFTKISDTHVLCMA